MTDTDPHAPTVHLVQMDIVWEDKDANYKRVESLLVGADVNPGDLIVLPELFDTGFSFRVEQNEDADGQTREFLADLARRTESTVHGSLTATDDDGHGRNRVVVVDPDGEIIAEYDKIHPFSYGREPEHFSGGDEITTYEWGAPGFDEDSLTVCPAICYDLRFPELFRLGLRIGAEAFAIGANWPSERAAHWRALLVARAIENQAFVFAVNRCGSDPHLSYSGGSLVVDPTGAVLGELGGDEGVLSVPVDLHTLQSWRSAFPAWLDMRLRDLEVDEEGDEDELGYA